MNVSGVFFPHGSSQTTQKSVVERLASNNEGPSGLMPPQFIMYKNHILCVTFTGGASLFGGEIWHREFPMVGNYPRSPKEGGL